MSKSYKVITFALLMCVGLFGACDRAETTTPTPNTENVKKDNPSKKITKGLDLDHLDKVTVHPMVADHINKIVAGCTVREKSGQAFSCKGKEIQTMRSWVRKESPGYLFESLAELMFDSDLKKSAAAIAMMNSLFTTKGNDWKIKNSTKAATLRLMKYVRDNEGTKAGTVAKYATHTAFINKYSTELFELINNHKTRAVQLNAYMYYMTFGRLVGLKELKRITADTSPKPNVYMDYVKASLKAPRNMYKPTAQEKAEWCPWALSFLSHKNLHVATEAGYNMVRCKGEYIDKLIDEGEKRVKSGEFKRPLSQVYREPCFSMMKGVIDKAAREKQCDRVFKFLQDVADNPAIESSVRGLSLWNIYYQRRDQKSLDLMRKYEKNKDPEIQKRAKDAIKSLTTTYKLK